MKRILSWFSSWGTTLRMMGNTPDWMEKAAKSARKTGLPSAILADYMRLHGEDPRDETLWNLRIDALDMILFGRKIRTGA